MQKRLAHNMDIAQFGDEEFNLNLIYGLNDVCVVELGYKAAVHYIEFNFSFLGRAHDPIVIDSILNALPVHGDEFHEYHVTSHEFRSAFSNSKGLADWTLKVYMPRVHLCTELIGAPD